VQRAVVGGEARRVQHRGGRQQRNRVLQLLPSAHARRAAPGRPQTGEGQTRRWHRYTYILKSIHNNSTGIYEIHVVKMQGYLKAKWRHSFLIIN